MSAVGAVLREAARAGVRTAAQATLDFSREARPPHVARRVDLPAEIGRSALEAGAKEALRRTRPPARRRKPVEKPSREVLDVARGFGGIPAWMVPLPGPDPDAALRGSALALLAEAPVGSVAVVSGLQGAPAFFARSEAGVFPISPAAHWRAAYPKLPIGFMAARASPAGDPALVGVAVEGVAYWDAPAKPLPPLPAILAEDPRSWDAPAAAPAVVEAPPVPARVVVPACAPPGVEALSPALLRQWAWLVRMLWLAGGVGALIVAVAVAG